MATMTTGMKKDYNYVSDAEYRRNKRAAAKARKNARRNRCILYCIAAIIVLMMTFKLGGWVDKITSRKLVVDHYVSYRVKDGDTLSSIASRFDMTDSKDYRFEMYAIIEANDCLENDASILQYDSVILVPIYKYELKEDCMSPNAVK
jgi:hypothetical protein|nr:MAG TPA: LysM domain [Caudoviricetes sp.]